MLKFSQRIRPPVPQLESAEAASEFLKELEREIGAKAFVDRHPMRNHGFVSWVGWDGTEYLEPEEEFLRWLNVEIEDFCIDSDIRDRLFTLIEAANSG